MEDDWYGRIPRKQSDNIIKTVGDLIAQLQRFDPSLPVNALWDTMPMAIWRVLEHEGAVLVDTD